MSAQKDTGEFIYQERLYIQTDKPYYAAGETIWWQCHLVDGETLRQAEISNLMTIELYDQNDELVMRKRIKRGDQGFAGGYTIPAKINPGNYYIRAYTHWMERMGKEWFPTKNIAITNPVDPRFSKNPLGQLDPEKAKQVALENEKELKGSALRKAQKDRKKELQKNKDFDCVFFPEGGELIDGLTQKVAFRVQGTDGMPQAATGVILDSNNETIQEFRTLHDGMGLFMVDANKKAQSKIRVTNEKGHTKEFFLSKAKKEGAALSLNVTPKMAQYRVSFSKGLNLKDSLFLVLRQRGHFISETYMPKGKYTGIIPTNILGEGVVQCLLVAGEDRVPLSSRMLFVRHNPLLNGLVQHAYVEAGAPASEVNKRQKVNTTITLKPLVQALNPAGLYAISVTDDKLVTPDSLGANIRSSLLLCDELKGTIYRPNYYFEDSSRKRTIQADLLMLTHGWRAYGNYAFKHSEESLELDALLKEQKDEKKMADMYTSRKEKKAYWSRMRELSKDIQNLRNKVYKNQREQKKKLESHYFERGQSISGRVTSMFGRSVKGAKIAAFVPKTKWTGVAEADEDGFFTMDNMLYKDTTSFVFQARTKGGNSHVQIKVEKQEFPTAYNTAPFKTLIPIEHQATYVNEMRRKYFEEGGMQVITLDEVLVDGHKKEPREETESVYLSGGGGDMYSGKEAAADGCNDAFDMLVRMPGVNATETSVLVKGESSISLIIDDSPYQLSTQEVEVTVIEDEGGTTTSTSESGARAQELVGVLRSIPVSSIKFLGVLDPVEAAAVGARPGVAAIVIETQDGFVPDNVKTPLGFMTVKRIGISDFPKFYTPKYDTPRQYTTKKTDIRSTLYWNPYIKVDSTGVAKVTWYTADSKSSYRVKLEGLTNQGVPVVVEEVIK